MRHPPLRLAMPVLCAVLAAGCTHDDAAYRWVHELPPEVSSSEYTISPGDQLNIRVWNQEGMSGRVRVRDDGKVSLPFLNDVVAAGYTPNVLAQQLQTRLKDFIVTPVVTVALEEGRPFAVSVIGEVVRPGVYNLSAEGLGVLNALAAAGGLNEYANDDRIFVLRERPQSLRIRFTYLALTRSGSPASAFRLRAGDVVVVE